MEIDYSLSGMGSGLELCRLRVVGANGVPVDYPFAADACPLDTLLWAVGRLVDMKLNEAAR